MGGHSSILALGWGVARERKNRHERQALPATHAGFF
jgi:hypothetical protein